jgi:hypothetical protein
MITPEEEPFYWVPPATAVPPPKKRRGRLIAALAAATVIAAGAAGTVTLLVTRHHAPPGPDTKAIATAACEAGVRGQLKAPSTARFSGESVFLNDGSYMITGDVDAQNSFGALLRQHWTCFASGTGTTWSARVQMGDSPAASPTPAAPPPIKAVYASAEELVAALNANDLPCGPPTTVAQPSLADTMIDCGPTVVVSTYASHELAERAFDLLASMGGDSKLAVHMAIGANWVVSGKDAAYVQRVAKAFNAEYRTT